ncbi:tetratricopeptide repeat protein [Cupriavidus agavae]|uniref:YEATS-Like-Associating Three TM domain-containing protein n=1 Tax=Cupriavidus agavae TaxID=1001822 RepID=A0A4Q7S175_9BURK|nr:tetratricopeptide repeat protein [Cupriavidus agavae]RZT38702.1 hypothetical protein EV147_3175 [Cupriavidus agavae]
MNPMQAVFSDPWWWTVFLTIFLSGMAGGVVRFVQMRPQATRRGDWLASTIMGVASAFLVPLFLNTISSSLIAESREMPEKLFVLIGFCIAAGFFAQQFLDSVGRRALRMSEEAKAAAQAAEATAQSAREHARAADNRAIAMWKVIQLIDDEAYAAALDEAEFVISIDPANAECWAWKAYCHKRLGDPQAAVTAIDQALRIERRDICNWLFNAACYRVLDGASFTEIKPFLLRAWHAASPSQQTWLHSVMQNEVDLAAVRNCQEYQAFISMLKKESRMRDVRPIH